MTVKLRSLMVGFVVLASTVGAYAAEPAAPSRLITQADMIGISVKKTLIASAAAGNGPFDITTAEAVEMYYDQHGNLPLWVDANGYNAKAKQVIAALKLASDWGLSPADYAVPETSVTLTDAKLAEAELALTRATVRYAHDAHVGRFDPARISELIDLMSTPPNATAVLNGVQSAVDPAPFLAAFNPQHSEFEMLRQKYLALRGDTVSVVTVRIPDGPRLKPGETNADIPLIRQRLRVFAPANGDLQMYDDVLAVAVKEFQATRGYKADGVVTPSMRRLLNQQIQAQPAKNTQIERILANMERWRWLPEDLGKSYVFDNIPEFLTRVVRDGRVIHTARIVVGKVDTPTPVFSKSMRYIEFHPFWKVPDSIKVKELLPSIARGGSGALARRGLRMSYNGKEVNPASVNFGTTDIRAYEIFQPPGGGNALGDVKFMFPNKFSVYMHDTPSKDLFADNVRAFSHGCMRVQDPHKLAEVIMGEANGWSPEQTKSQFADQNNAQVQLDRPLPVHVTYFTVRATADGQLQYIDDIYGHDRRTTNAMAGRWNQVNKQLAPKVTDEPTVLADYSFGSNGKSSTKLFGSSGSGNFADIFNLSGNGDGTQTRKGRRHRVRVYGGSGSSGYVGNTINNNPFGGLLGGVLNFTSRP